MMWQAADMVALRACGSAPVIGFAKRDVSAAAAGMAWRRAMKRPVWGVCWRNG
ncbi:hypothetical protein Ade02nite_04190 [Paractinoplanes deccanensis]|uniref:Uncharacterized protein n=1 Tax=Paractinoplanes deccanensis TaxID=113561 RepID=A0ABQ3XVL7_9ACTN|nr:hypothetical protein Ade02nite_04190 [Actinoplanes deccanensis]